MKLFAIILCISILALSCISCEDFELANNLSIVTEQIINQENSHQESDNCSPLCTCNCCGQLIVFNQKVELLIKPKPLNHSKNVATYCNYFLSDYTKNIWQPPKLNS
ncbi:DUF6660 family protein [Pedobacter sp.]|uniref:DUF6660 family protein n=1 Tax=Pedobacter sp. TaxID=1411316 RepID=UPI003BACDE5D